MVMEINCSSPLENVLWSDWTIAASLIVLGFINIVVLVGNCLVVMAVFLSAKLRTATNFFIVSLAIADLLVGVAVLPFSATLEVFDVWIFGELWCSAWLAVDVWMCTASILNLCAISLDRYLAVTRPVLYPSLMTSQRAKGLIAAVWILSFVICFPPLVGWNDRHSSAWWERKAEANATSECSLTCELTNDPGYVLYSAFGSFYIPMLVMLFFYWRIYRAAVRTSKAINQGFRTTKEGNIKGREKKGDGKPEKERLTLRIHRGKPKGLAPLTGALLAAHGPPGLGAALAGLGGQRSAQALAQARENLRNSWVVDSADASLENGHASSEPPQENQTSPWHPSPSPRPIYCDACGTPANQPVNTASTCHHIKVPAMGQSNGVLDPAKSIGNGGTRNNRPDVGYSVLYTRVPPAGASQTQEMERSQCYVSIASGARNKRAAENWLNLCKKSLVEHKQSTLQLPPRRAESDALGTPANPVAVPKLSRRNIKAQVKRFRTEAKAAKTLGVIVGGFVLCWLPFFTMYVIRGFCPTCIPPLLFSVLFWLGYCNSAINPFLYARFSRDFRSAFQKILCRCVCTREAHPTTVPAAGITSIPDDSENDQ